MLVYRRNCTEQKEFHLLVFSESDKVQFVLFTGILLMFLLAVFGNLLIMILICLVPQLHTAMYFFLCNLSIQDIIYVSAILPKFLVVTMTGDTAISFPGCMTQMFLFTFCVGTEFFLLTSMAYDRYVAICVPLRYSIIMNNNVCILLAIVSWMMSIFNSLTYCLLISKLKFCSRGVNHFYCDLKTILKLSTSDTMNIHIAVLVVCVVLGFFPFMMIIMSYICIISTILNIQTSAGRTKAFSSCSSHLTVVFLFYGTSLTFYLKPQSVHAQEQDKLLSLLYTAVVPMLNPLVYSLRNKEVLRALRILTEKYSTGKIQDEFM
ncbi:olfactory receptor 5V1-like [Spea bombifrons]|uniref:olfactory receptor 5V1-like n=1 Tax=Spea bombifrons TaxID=233779 RepID=UPI00234A44D1|nr:olfactory receptor 5V1-like [Spea bombifrons]